MQPNDVTPPPVAVAPHQTPTVDGCANPYLAEYHHWKDTERLWHKVAERDVEGNMDTPEAEHIIALEHMTFSVLGTLMPTTPKGVAALIDTIWQRQVAITSPEVRERALQQDATLRFLDNLHRVTGHHKAA